MNSTQNKKEIPSILSKANILAGDRVLWIIVAILFVVSLLVVYSSVAKMGYSPYWKASTNAFLRKHVISLLLSGAALVVAYLIDCKYYRRAATLFFIVALGLTIATYIPGIGRAGNGAARWFELFGIRFQPSELLKIATVLFLAQQLSVRQRGISELRIVPSFNPLSWLKPEQRKIWRTGTVPVLLPVLLACAVILKSHTSSALLVFATSFVMMCIGRISWREIWRIAVLVMFCGCIAYSFKLGRASTAGGRVSTWIESWSESYAEQTTKPIYELTDTECSMIAIHNGGIVGQGAGRSVMRSRITHPESDYIFAFFVEEYGIIMAIFLVLLYLWIFFRSIRIFGQCNWIFAGLLELGLGLLITTQAMLHIMVTINLAPETGQNLPLISNGRTSMICAALALGMILSVSRQVESETLVAEHNESMTER